MRLLFLCHGAGNGGAERVITSLASEFAKRGNNVVMVTTNEDHNDYEMYKTVKRVRIISHARSSALRSINRVLKLRKEIKRFEPNCIISFSSIPNIQAIVANIGLKSKLIISERTDPNRYPTSNIGKKIRTFLYPFADEIVFQTDDAKKYFKSINKIYKKGIVIVNPISDSLPEPYEGEREHRIVGVGSLGEQKNWPIALDACQIFFQSYPDYTFDIYGEGPDRDSLQKKIDNNEWLKGRVHLCGFSKDVINEVRIAKMYISSSNYDGIPNSMLEALAVGTPTIYTDCPVGGPRMFINNGENGFLVPVEDSVALADAMKELAENRNICDKFSKNSVQIKKNISLVKIANKWEEEIKKICNKKHQK